MSFRDKLKKGKKPVKKDPKMSSDAGTLSSLPSLNEFSDESDKPAIKGGGNRPQKKPRAGRSNKPAKAKSAKSNKKSLVIVAGVLLLVVVVGLGAFLANIFLGGSDDVTAENPAVTQPVPEQPAPEQPIVEGEVTADGTPVPDNSMTNVEAENTPNAALTMDDSVKTKLIAPEMLNEDISDELPQTQVIAAEELDSLADETARLEEQEQHLQAMMSEKEQVLKLKQEQIALLEQQIAEAEVKAGSQ